MRVEDNAGRDVALRGLQWSPRDARAGEAESQGTGQVRLASVDARAGDATTRRVFRGRLHNAGERTAAVTLEVSLPPPFLPSAAVLMQRLFTIAPGETLRVELGSTVGAAPGIEEVRQAVQLMVG